jgi:hypothetical protein
MHLTKYNKELGKYVGFCQFSQCGKKYSGRKNRKYCSLSCKNKVSSINREKKYVVLRPEEEKLRRNEYLIKLFNKEKLLDNWINSDELVKYGYEEDHYHNKNYNEAGIIEYKIFNFTLLLNSKNQIKLKK